MELPELDGDGWAVDKDANWGKPERQRVIADWVAAEVTEILEMNIQSGTGVGANIGRTAGGKTGTTENHADAWFCGITPTLSGTVWVGYPQAEIPMTSVHGISVAGGTFPAQIWRLFMEEAIGSTPERDFPEPQSEPIWHEFTRGEYGGEVPSSSYYYPPPAATTTTQSEQPAPPPPSEPRPAPLPPPPPPPEPPPIPPPAPTEPPPAASPSPRCDSLRASRRSQHPSSYSRAPFPTVASSGRSGTGTSTCMGSTRTGSSAESFHTGTSSSSTRPARSRSFCRRPCSRAAPTTSPSRA